MQPLTAPPRDQLTAVQIVDLLQNANAPYFAGGLEIVDLNLDVIEDISDHLAGGSITRNSYADLHATASLQITRELDWGAGLVRPYLTVSDRQVTARFNLGVYHTSTPSYSTAESPPTFDVEGHDLLLRLAYPVGNSWEITKGAPYLAAVEQILINQGYTQYIIDPTAADKTAPSARVWTLDDAVTWLVIVNDLLASIGYAGIWADWDGRLRVAPYILPADRAVEWVYTDDQATTMVGPELVIERDFFASPNKWVIYRQNNVDDVTPVEGNGKYTWVNQSIGETSVDARGGLVIPKVLGVDTADQASLIVQAQAIIAADMNIDTLIEVNVAPNPAHWHMDRLRLEHAAVNVADVQCTSWTLALPPATDDMQLELRVIAQ